MLLSAVSVLVVAQSSSEVPEGLMNNPVLEWILKVVKWNVGDWTYSYVAKDTVHRLSLVNTGFFTNRETSNFL